jgi:hypothetical protein
MARLSKRRDHPMTKKQGNQGKKSKPAAPRKPPETPAKRKKVGLVRRKA